MTKDQYIVSEYINLNEKKVRPYEVPKKTNDNAY